MTRRVSSSMPAVRKRSRRSRLFVEDPDGGVTRARQLARDLEQPPEHSLRIKLRDQRPPDVQQTQQARLIHEFVLVRRPRP